MTKEKLPYISYICIMKAQKIRRKKAIPLREEILKSMLASFKIEGIIIPHDLALKALKKVEFSLGKQNG